MTQIAANGQIFNYEEFGQGSKAPLVILHGWGRSGKEWERLAVELARWEDRKVYVLDLPGFGGSPLPRVENLAEYSQLVEDFCKYLELEKIVLVGHSLGGRVGIVLSSTTPTRVEKLILIDPAGIKPKSIKRGGLKLLAKLFGWMPRNWRQNLLRPVMDEDYRNTPALRALYRVVVREDLREYLPRIKSETTVIWGELDPILPLSLVDIYRKLLPNPKIRVVWGARHDPHLSHFEQILRILQEEIE